MQEYQEFGTFRSTLQAAGVSTRTARGFWGGVAEDGALVVTSWKDACRNGDRYPIWKPTTNHGGLKAQWDLGNVSVGVEVRLIVVCARKEIPIGEPGRSVAGAVLMPGKWRIESMSEHADGSSAVVGPAP